MGKALMQTPFIEKVEKVWTPDSKLHISHNEKLITFAYPSVGPYDYPIVGKDILRKGMRIPTGDYTASLLHTAYCNEPLRYFSEFHRITRITREAPLWVFNINLWIKDGVYTIQDLKGIGTNQPLHQKDLEKMLRGGKEIKGIRFSKDKKVRFAPKETYELGRHTPESLSRDGFVIENYDFEGAEKLGEVSAKIKGESKTYGVEGIKEGYPPGLRVSAIGVDYNQCLNIFGSYLEKSVDGHAFGVLLK